jgi:hypothetical protein
MIQTLHRQNHITSKIISNYPGVQLEFLVLGQLIRMATHNRNYKLKKKNAIIDCISLYLAQIQILLSAGNQLFHLKY